MNLINKINNINMNREIKFRAWDKNHMVYNPELYSNNCVEKAQKAGVILMQFIGLKDTNGKEIYEGDIVGFCDVSVAGTNDHAPIYWDEETLSYKADIGYEHRTLKQGMDNETLEIIGNIYENLDLIVKG